MDNKKKETILSKIQEFFSSNDIDAEVVVKDENADVQEKFETVLLADGSTEITVEPAIEVGAAIVLTSEDGTPVAAPAGEYALQDGRVLVVAEEGVVAEVKSEEVEEEPMATDTPEQADKVKRIIERIESEKIFEKIAELEEAFTKKEEEVKFLKEENESLTESFNDLKTFTKETLETLLGEPSAEPVVEKNSFDSFVKEDAIDKWMEKHLTD